MQFLFRVEHLIERKDWRDDIKLIGVFSSQEKAEEAVDYCRKLPGFSEHLEGFFISRCEVDKRHWVEGFVDLGTPGSRD